MCLVVGMRVGGKLNLCCAVSGSVTSIGHHDPDVKLSPQTTYFFPYNVFPVYEFVADFSRPFVILHQKQIAVLIFHFRVQFTIQDVEVNDHKQAVTTLEVATAVFFLCYTFLTHANESAPGAFS